MKIKQLFICLAALACFQFSQAQSNYIGAGISTEYSGLTGNRVDLGDVFNTLNFPVSVEAWVKPTGWTPSGYSPIIALDNVGVGGSYYGFWFRFNSTGQLIFEIGDGSGAGGSDRRGKRTTTSVDLDTWSHVAVVASSVTDIKFYFNGVLQPSVNTDGGAINTSILHTTYPAYIGAQITPAAQHNFTGQIDEVRLWNVLRTEEELRAHMCAKLSTYPVSLIGYWNFDESYASSSVLDLTSPAESGEVVGMVEKVTSGAAIGDESIYEYTEDWTGIKMKLDDDSDDYLRVKKIQNAPLGMHVYRVDAEPYSTEGLTDACGFYYGVFPVHNTDSAIFGISYKFTVSNGVYTVPERPQSTLYVKEDGSVATWSNLDASIDVHQDFIRKTNRSDRFELIFNIDGPGLTDGYADHRETESKAIVSVYPNPGSSYLYISTTVEFSRISICDLNGRIVYEQDYTLSNSINPCMVDVADWANGVYVVNVVDLLGHVASEKIFVQH